MGITEIISAEGINLSETPASEIAPGDWTGYESENGQRSFKTRAGLVRSAKASMAHYPANKARLIVGMLRTGAWVGYIDVSKAA